MKLLLITFLVSFITANLTLIQQNYILNKISRYEFFCAKNTLLFLFVVFYMSFVNKDIYKNIINIEYKNWKYILLDVILSIINIILWYYLLENTQAHKLISTINPLTIIFIAFLSCMFYNKNVSRNDIFGITLVLIGLIFINKK
jgi:uncharacterized membrane protein